LGHETLIQKCRKENDVCALSIFVNPTQFNDKKDFEKYPNTFDSDLKIAERNSVDVVFAPTFESMYPDNYKYKLSEQEFSRMLCGKDRPGHFDGVLTIVMKLFQIVRPNRAYFGEKDFQQLSLIQGMIRAFFLPVEIVPVATVREQSGLAMSSRNARLNEIERVKAAEIYKVIKNSKTAPEAESHLQSAGFKVDYVFDLNNRRFVAATIADVRLIDNVEI
jgi:pantoate--beta-alanine ligase